MSGNVTLKNQNMQRYRVYRFIIDRRDKENLKRKSMKYRQPNSENDYRKIRKDKSN